MSQSVERVYAFTKQLGVETYDPYDIKATPLAVWSYQRPSPFRTIVRKALYGAELFFPLALRRVMGIRKRETAGGSARWAQANIARYRALGGDDCLPIAESVLRGLLDRPGVASVGIGWGVPFVWQTYFGTVPANTAVAHTTQTVGHALLDFFDATGEKWARDAAFEAGEYITRGLNQTVRGDGTVALSYTPHDHSQVINVSAEVAGFLKRLARPQDQGLVQGLASFVCSTQNEDGSWLYSAADSFDGYNPIDNYHTGMNLGGLLPLLDEPRTLRSFEQGLRFHLGRHFEEDGCPKMRPDSKYPVDSYSAGESILVLTKVVEDTRIGGSLRESARATLDKLVQFTVNEMGDARGGFVYRRFPHRDMTIDSLRWAQALLCQALIEYEGSGVGRVPDYNRGVG